jgi:hypothetical protein
LPNGSPSSGKGVIVEEAEPGRFVDMSLRRIHLRFKAPVDLEPLLSVTGITLIRREDSQEVVLQVKGDMEALVHALGRNARRRPAIGASFFGRSVSDLLPQRREGGGPLMMAEFKHALKRLKGQAIGWSIGIGLYGIMMVYLYPYDGRSG